MAFSSLPFLKRAQSTEDTVSYWLYADKEIQVASILSAVVKLTHDYVWHEETFSLSSKDKVMNQLRGSTRFGANVEDEWFVVHILLELTLLFPGLVARVSDDDGEFLLIEAADVLPDWLDSDTSENRVFLMNGQVHLIPNDASFPSKIETPLDGANIVRRSAEITVSKPITPVIRARCSQTLPQKNRLSHRAQCLLPSALASICHDRPDLLAAAIVAVFNGRESKNAKVYREMRCADSDLVQCSVVFTKAHFAMLTKRALLPDRRSDWPLPKADEAGYQSSLLGFKLSCGFELLKRQATSNDAKSLPVDSSLVDEVTNKLSQEYYYFLSMRRRMKDLVERMVVGDRRGLVARQLQTALSEQSESASALMHQLAEKLPPDDDASWLDVQEKDLPNGFDAAFAKETADMFSDLLSSDAAGNSRPKKLARKVRNFLTEGSGPVEGAEFKKRTNTKNGNGNGISFDADNFEGSLNKILSLEGAHDKEPYASPSDSDVSYGDETLEIDLNEASLNAAAKMNGGLRAYMREMDRELRSTNVTAGFERHMAADDSIDDVDDADFHPVDIDKNLVGNLLRSYWSEAGCSAVGPASTLLHGVRLAEEEQLDSDDEEDLA